MIQKEIINEETGDIQHVVYYQVSDLAKALNLKIGKKYIGRNTMFKILKAPENRILTRDNQPSQSLIQLDLWLLYGIRKGGHYYYSPVMTERGLNYMIQGFKSGRYTAVYEQTIKTPKLKLSDVC